MILKIILTLVMICVIVISHEFGHYIIARARGISVKEFFVGVGPDIIKKKKCTIKSLTDRKYSLTTAGNQ